MQYKIIVDKQPRTNPSSDKRQYTIDIEELRYLGDIYDSLIITKDADYVIRRLSLSEYGVLSVLEKEVIQPIDNINIELFEGDNYIYLADMTGNYIYAEYLLKNEFTDMYITEAEMNTAIKQTEQTITLSVNQKLTSYSTIQELTNAKNEAIDTANGNTDEKLKDYTTTIEMEAKIEASADGVKTEVSKTYSTIENTNQAKQDAIDEANNSTDDKLKDYSTTLEMNTAIDVKADGITSSVSKIYATKDEVYSSVGTVNLVNNSDFSHKDESDNYDLKNWTLLLGSENSYVREQNKVVLLGEKTWFRMYASGSTGTIILRQILKPANYNEDYTLSLKFKNNDDTLFEDERRDWIDAVIYTYSSDGTVLKTQSKRFNVGTSLEEQDLVFNFKTIDDERVSYFTFEFTTTTLDNIFDAYITNIQLEKGNVATEWRPSQTDFYYQVEQYSKVTQTVEELQSEVGKKVGEDEIISKINQSAEQVAIDANKISLKRKRNKFNRR